MRPRSVITCQLRVKGLAQKVPKGGTAGVKKPQMPLRPRRPSWRLQGVGRVVSERGYEHLHED